MTANTLLQLMEREKTLEKDIQDIRRRVATGLRDIRVSYGWSYRTAAQHIKCDASNLCKIENGKVWIGPLAIKAIKVLLKHSNSS